MVQYVWDCVLRTHTSAYGYIDSCGLHLDVSSEVSSKNHQRLCWLCSFITKLMDKVKEDIKFVGVAGVSWRRMIGCEDPRREQPWGQNHYYYHYYYFWSGTIRRGREQDVFMPTVKVFTVAVRFRGSHITKCTLSQRSHKSSIWHLQATPAWVHLSFCWQIHDHLQLIRLYFQQKVWALARLQAGMK